MLCGVHYVIIYFVRFYLHYFDSFHCFCIIEFNIRTTNNETINIYDRSNSIKPKRKEKQKEPRGGRGADHSFK